MYLNFYLTDPGIYEYESTKTDLSKISVRVSYGNNIFHDLKI